MSNPLSAAHTTGLPAMDKPAAAQTGAPQINANSMVADMARGFMVATPSAPSDLIIHMVTRVLQNGG
jgi:hypothetical protein